MENIKRYIDCYIPTETCNLICGYCYITQKRKFSNKIASFTHSPQDIRQALSKKRFGGTCLINLCAGGETLLSDEVLPVVFELLREGHYVTVVTNGTLTERFKEAAQWPKELTSHLFFKISFHYLEMKRLGWLGKFFDNVRIIRDANISYTVEVTPSDELIPHIEDLKAECINNLGAYCHITIARNDQTDKIDILSKHTWEEYKEIWGVFDSALFNFKTELFFKKRKEFCYAGAWSYYLNLESGDIKQCYCGEVIGNIYSDTMTIVPEVPIGTACLLPHCYNGHAFLALGDIPELHAPTYADERNRLCADGSEWLQPDMKLFMSTKLFDSNEIYPFWRRRFVGFKQWCVRRGIRDTHIYKLLHK